MENQKAFEQVTTGMNEFFKSFFALSYQQGKEVISIPSFKRFLKKNSNDKNIIDTLNESVMELQKEGKVVIDIEQELIRINNTIQGSNYISNNTDRMEQLFSIFNRYRDYVNEETARAYDMMIDQEAVDMFNRNQQEQMHREWAAHARYHGI